MSNDPRAVFEQYLKNSNYFHDTVNSHRRATAQVIAGICGLLMDDAIVSEEALTAKLRALEDQSAASDVSDAVGRRALAPMIREELKARGLSSKRP